MTTSLQRFIESTKLKEGSTSEPSGLKDWIEYNFPIIIDKIEPDVLNNELEATEESFRMLSLSFCLQSLVMPKIEEHMRKSIAPKFWSKFVNAESCDEKQGFHNFTLAVNELYSDSSRLLPMLKKLQLSGPCLRDKCEWRDADVVERFKVSLRGTLLSQAPALHATTVEHFYRTALNVFCQIEASASSVDPERPGPCEGCERERTDCRCQAVVDVFHETNARLVELGLLERLAGSTLTALIQARIETHVARVCARSFDASQLRPLEDWLENVVLAWLRRIYSGGSARTLGLPERLRRALAAFERKLSHSLYETYGRLRIAQLFNIVIEFPESRPAVEDLRACLARTDLRGHLVSSLRRSLRARLLHPGVGTPDILTAYVSAMKALRLLEPSGALLETVTAPVRAYLRSREDTVRCVVSGLLEDGASGELAEELARAAPGPAEEDWRTWEPEPVDAAAEAPAPASGPGDVLGTLVGVYGSQDLFVNEYRTLLADRLLSQLDYRTDRELRQLELLKRRFGESQLHHCEVMIRDVCDSRRLDGSVQQDARYLQETRAGAGFETSALVLSAQFWPPFKDDCRLELPEPVRRQLDRYVRAFEALKANRTLCWKPHLGSVRLELELRDRTLTVDATPLQAVVILLFERRTEWPLEELATAVRVPATVLRRKLGFWLAQGVLAEAPGRRDVFVLQEELRRQARPAPAAAELCVEDEEAESAMASASDQREEELQVFWSYIVGMLTNLDSMPLERIHQMLKMFASQGSGAVECGLPELRLFLDKKVREHQLLFSGGFYKLPKP